MECVLKLLNITHIDIFLELEKEKDTINFYPFGLQEHFIACGYRLDAENIFKNKIN